jgi:replicative DNA helicase
MSDLVKESFPKIEQLFEQKRLITGVPTGFVDLDTMTRGLQAGDLVIVAARPSMGKTSLVLNVAQHVAMQPGFGVGFFSLEMSKESLFLRLLTSEAQIDSHRLMSGAIGQKDYGRISHALETLSAMRLFIDDTASVGVLEMRAKARPAPVRARTEPARRRLHSVDERPWTLRGIAHSSSPASPARSRDSPRN